MEAFEKLMKELMEELQALELMTPEERTKYMKDIDNRIDPVINDIFEIGYVLRRERETHE